MSPNPALIIFTSLGIASVFLALVIEITDNEPADLVAGIAALNPGERK